MALHSHSQNPVLVVSCCVGAVACISHPHPIPSASALPHMTPNGKHPLVHYRKRWVWGKKGGAQREGDADFEGAGAELSCKKALLQRISPQPGLFVWMCMAVPRILPPVASSSAALLPHNVYVTVTLMRPSLGMPSHTLWELHGTPAMPRPATTLNWLQHSK